MSFEFLDHTGDSAVRLRAASLENLFVEATRALARLYAGSEAALERLRPRIEPTRARLELEAEDLEALLVDLLNELIFRFDVESRLTLDLERVDVQQLARRGDPPRVRFLADLVSVAGIEVGEVHTEVKAATFHDLAIEESVTGEFTARVVFDL